MDYRIENRKDTLLVLLYAKGARGIYNEPIEGRTRLVKLVFLFQKEVSESFFKSLEDYDDALFYDFTAFKFGPFSKEIYQDVEFFALNKFIDVEYVGVPEDYESMAERHLWEERVGVEPDKNFEQYRMEKFSLGDKGKRYAKSLYATLSNAQKNYIEEFKANFQKRSLKDILKYVYENYPEMASESDIKDSIMN
jgi:hypothetical protein